MGLMGIGKGGSPTTTNNTGLSNQVTNQNQTQTGTYSPFGLPNFQNIYNRADQASQTPYQPYTGQLVADMSLAQNAGMGNIYNNAGLANQYINYGQQAGLNTGAGLINPGLQMGVQSAGYGQNLTANNLNTPLTSQIGQYENPFQQDVINATMGNINETNAQQNQQIRGNAIAQHALGGDREAVAEAELARQQNLSNNQTLAGLNQANYSQALGTAQQQQQFGLQGAQQYANLGLAGQGAYGNAINQYNQYGMNTANMGLQAQNAAISGGQAEMNAGAVAQQNQQAQLTAQYQQYLQRLAYPYQQAQFLAGIGIPASGGMGGTQNSVGTQSGTMAGINLGNNVTTPPGLSWGQAGLGLGLLGLGLFAKRGGRINHMASGGNPYDIMPWDAKSIDVTQVGAGKQVPIDTPKSQITPMQSMPQMQPMQQMQNQQTAASRTDPFQQFASTAKNAKSLLGIGKNAASFFGLDTGAIPVTPDVAISTGTGAIDALAPGAGDMAATDAGLSASADLWPLFAGAKHGGRINPYAVGGNIGDEAESAVAAAADKGGELTEDMLTKALNPYINTARPPPFNTFRGQQPYQTPYATGGHIKGYADTGAVDDTEDDDSSDTSPDAKAAMLAAANKAEGAPTQIPISGVSPPLPPPAAGDAELPVAAKPTSGVVAPVTGGLDPDTMSSRDIMNLKNFQQYGPQHNSLMSLLKDPKTRGEALMEIGLRTLAAPPGADRSGLNALASGTLGTVQDYNKFSSENLSAQQKAQELALRLKKMSQDAGTEDVPVPRVIGTDALGKNIYGVYDSKLKTWVDPTTRKPVDLEKAQTDREGAMDKLAKGIADYTIPPPSSYRMLTPEGRMLMSAVKGINPDYDVKWYNEANKARRDFGSGPLGNSVRSFDVSLAHLDVLDQAVDDLKNNNMRLSNTVRQKFQTEFGTSTAPTSFDAIKPIVAAEITKAIVGARMTEADRHEIQVGLQKDLATMNIKEVIRKYKQLMAGQLVGLERQFTTSTHGAKDFQDKLSAPARNMLQQGHAVEIESQFRSGAGPQLQPQSQPQPQPSEGAKPQRKFFQGKWWIKGPNGEAIPDPNQ